MDVTLVNRTVNDCDYEKLVALLANQSFFVLSTNRSFVYVPFNEPDNIWYNKTDKKAQFFSDWKTVSNDHALAPAIDKIEILQR
jgi:hypothetical protein